MAILETLPAQPVYDIQAAYAVMAEHDERGFGRLDLQVTESGWDGAHGDQIAAGDPGERVFMRFSNINEMKLLTGVDAPLDVLRGDFEGQNFFSSSTRPARPFLR